MEPGPAPEVRVSAPHIRVACAPDSLLAVATDLVREAGALLLERYLSGGSGQVATKSSPTDLVSEADLAAEHTIVSRLHRLRPDDGVLGEEGAGSTGQSGLRWVVDPLDGTVNFLFGIPQWCVSIAVEDAYRTTLAGAIYDPCRDELWTAVKDGDAALNGTPISGSEREQLATAMVATGLAYDEKVRSLQAAVLARLIPQVRDIRRFGSAALDLAWTAAGRYDAYFERSVKLWDVAAGLLICSQAGLTVCELAPEQELPWGVLACAPAIANPLLELIVG